MSDESRAFEVPIGQGTIRVDLHDPRGPGGIDQPVVLVCPRLPGSTEETAGLERDLIAVLGSAGLLVVTYQPRWARRDRPDSTEYRGADAIDEAWAVGGWLIGRDEVDSERIGVMGVGSGGIVAACLTGRTDRLAALCLIGVPSAEDVKAGVERADEQIPTAPPGFAESLTELHPVDEAAAFGRPTLILHGAADRAVAPERGLAYLDRIETAGHPVELRLLARGDHELSEPSVRAAGAGLMAAFFAAMPVPVRSARE